MRIVSGRLGGRIFDSPGGHRTHPMSEKMRGALFNILGDIGGHTVLDAFAGSGALGFEAISRGAVSVTAIESDVSAYKTIVTNAKKLSIEEDFKAVHANVNTWLDTNDQNFAIVICDPPYDHIRPDLLKKLSLRTKPGGLAVFSLPPDYELSLDKAFVCLKVKNYGDGSLVIYRNNG